MLIIERFTVGKSSTSKRDGGKERIESCGWKNVRRNSLLRILDVHRCERDGLWNRDEWMRISYFCASRSRPCGRARLPIFPVREYTGITPREIYTTGNAYKRRVSCLPYPRQRSTREWLFASWGWMNRSRSVGESPVARTKRRTRPLHPSLNLRRHACYFRMERSPRKFLEGGHAREEHDVTRTFSCCNRLSQMKEGKTTDGIKFYPHFTRMINDNFLIDIFHLRYKACYIVSYSCNLFADRTCFPNEIFRCTY